MSKSGLFAHFGSKEQLQLRRSRPPRSIFEDEVLRPALEAEGLARVEALCERSHVERGCFRRLLLRLGEDGARHRGPGPVRDRVVAVQRAWTELMEGAIGAQEPARWPHSADPVQLTFEINASSRGQRALPPDRRSPAFAARRGIADWLERAAA